MVSSIDQSQWKSWFEPNRRYQVNVEPPKLGDENQAGCALRLVSRKHHHSSTLTSQSAIHSILSRSGSFSRGGPATVTQSPSRKRCRAVRAPTRTKIVPTIATMREDETANIIAATNAAPLAPARRAIVEATAESTGNKSISIYSRTGKPTPNPLSQSPAPSMPF